MKQCPFHIGDKVVLRRELSLNPSYQAWFSDTPQEGIIYVIRAIDIGRDSEGNVDWALRFVGIYGCLPDKEIEPGFPASYFRLLREPKTV